MYSPLSSNGPSTAKPAITAPGLARSVDGVEGERRYTYCSGEMSLPSSNALVNLAASEECIMLGPISRKDDLHLLGSALSTRRPLVPHRSLYRSSARPEAKTHVYHSSCDRPDAHTTRRLLHSQSPTERIYPRLDHPVQATSCTSAVGRAGRDDHELAVSPPDFRRRWGSAGWMR